ncbi:choice-of-anchor Q domain-containing protein [Haliscomenobacter sp.]|uniref:choice-of-anchor Q domain-containing protein n=1 Tax=Haliscomenobacter sp. TaxID=2717303 RepID=UPI003593BD68
MKYLSPFKPVNAVCFLTVEFALFCCALFFFGQSLQAQTTRTVCASGCDFTTIAAAVAASANGDIIHVNTALHTEINVAIANKNLTIRGNGIAATTVQGAASRSTAAGRIFIISGTSVVIIEDLKIQHGNSGAGGAINIDGSGSFSANRVHFYRNDALEAFQNREGGAIYSLSAPGHSLSFIECIFEENRCVAATNTSRGGAIQSLANAGAGTFTVSKCIFLNNSAVNTGGAINAGSGSIAWAVTDCTFDGNSVSNTLNGNGGAINANSPFAGGINRCLFTNNSAGLNGGAIRFSFSSMNLAELTNCTFFNNTAVNGAGFFRQNSATGNLTTRIVNCTFSQNTASGNGSGIYYGSATGSTMQIVNTIFNHPSKDIYVDAAAGDFTGSTKNYGNNCSGVASAPCLTFDYNTGNSTLGLNATLANNGGSTQTLELLATSTLRNVGVNTATGATVPIKDQRNYSRTDGGIDLGAYERDGVVDNTDAPVITYTALANDPSTSDRTLTATITDANGVYPFATLAADLRPRIYFRKNAGSWNSSAGSLTSGTGRNGTWNFTISAAAMGGLSAADQVCYYVIAEDVSSTVNISSNPAGVVATSVNSVTTPPTPNCYTIGAAPTPRSTSP